MNVVYLRNGEKCELIEKLSNGKFLVEHYFVYNGYDEQSDYEQLSGSHVVVSEVFNNPPLAVIDNEVLEKEALLNNLKSAVSEMQAEERKLKHFISQIQKTKIDNEKYIINRTDLLNAKDVAVFHENKVMPTVKSKQKYGLKLSIEIKMNTGEERVWSSQLYYEDDNYNSSDYIDQKQGILIDPTDDELDAIILKRVDKLKSNLSKLVGVPEKYLTPDLIQSLKEQKELEKAKKISGIDVEIKKLEERKHTLLSERYV